jgi:hypothetical protein
MEVFTQRVGNDDVFYRRLSLFDLYHGQWVRYQYTKKSKNSYAISFFAIWCFPSLNLFKNQSILIIFICNGEINIYCEHHSQLTCYLFPDVKSRDFLLSNIQFVCDVDCVLWKEFDLIH